MRILTTTTLFVLALASAQACFAGPLRERLQALRDTPAAETALDGESDQSTGQLPGTRRLADIAYGPGPLERYDIYLPEKPVRDAPVIFMVHGGAWKTGDKRHSRVVTHKVEHWVSHGFIFVSTNYPMLPDADPLNQACQVARALAHAQSHAGDWGGSASHFVLMGHSAGAHLVALLNANPTRARSEGARNWLGTVALDSAAMDIERIMTARHFRFYDQAFGQDPAYWQALSPSRQLQADSPPALLICSSRRDDSCNQAGLYAARAKVIGRRAQVQPEDLSHGEINEQLGLPGAYTAGVDAFLASLSPALAERLVP